MKLRYTANAQRRLRQVQDFNGGKKGKKVVNRILDRADELETYPELGPVEDRLKPLNQGHRSLLVGTLYKIVYLIVKPFIIITDIFDVRQDPDKMKP
jgi:plasmid stabilization system protein ParE